MLLRKYCKHMLPISKHCPLFMLVKTPDLERSLYYVQAKLFTSGYRAYFWEKNIESSIVVVFTNTWQYVYFFSLIIKRPT